MSWRMSWMVLLLCSCYGGSEAAAQGPALPSLETSPRTISTWDRRRSAAGVGSGAAASTPRRARVVGGHIPPVVSEPPADQRLAPLPGHPPGSLSSKLKQIFPPQFQGRHFWLEDYQWISLLVVVMLGFCADAAVRFLLHQATATWLRIFTGRCDAGAERGLWKPVGLLVQALVWYGGTSIIGLPDAVVLVILAGLKFFAVIAAVWTVFHGTDLLAGLLGHRAAQTPSRFDELLIPLVSKSIKVCAVCLGALMCAEAFHLPLTGLLGGLGIGGAAIAIASKDAIANLFGSVTVLVDRPFEIGDWIVTEDMEGTVEKVGFRSTRVRTFYNSVITVPNSRFTNATVDNMGRRKYRRMKMHLGVEYATTPEQIEAFCEGIRELIRRQRYTRKDFYQVYFHQFSGSSLDILVYCFFDCPEWTVELRERHSLLLEIIRLARSLDVNFAFPTQTVHMFQQQHSSPERTLHFRDPLAVGQHEAAKITGPIVAGPADPGWAA